MQRPFDSYAKEEANLAFATVCEMPPQMVTAQMQGKTRSVDLTSAAFYRNPRGIVETLVWTAPPLSLTRLATILPPKGRRQKWRAHSGGKRTNLKLPDLQHPAQ